MGNITTEDIFVIFLVFGYVLGVFLALGSLRKSLLGTRIRGFLVIPAIAGLALFLPLLSLHFEATIAAFSRISVNLTIMLALSLAASIGAVALGDLLLNRVSNLAVTILKFIRIVRKEPVTRWIGDLSMTLSLGISVFVILAAASVLSPGIVAVSENSAASDQFIVEAQYKLPAPPLGLVMRNENEGYLTIEGGKILRFVLPENPSDGIALETVAEGFGYARGLTIFEDKLFMSDSGSMKLHATIGSVWSFDVLPDGKLENQRAILSNLPAPSAWHGVNGIVVGPDEKLYLSIGGETPSLLQDNEIVELTGSILRFNQDGSNLEVFAKGFRNIYSIAFDENGRLWGTDNDGASFRSWHMEEVIQIKEGANYGFPFEGTFDISTVRTDDPVWVLSDTEGSAGIEWAPFIGMEPGLLIGSRRKLEYLPLLEDESGIFVAAEGPELLMEWETGFVSFIEADSGRLFLGLYGFRRGGFLFVLKPNDQAS